MVISRCELESNVLRGVLVWTLIAATGAFAQPPVADLSLEMIATPDPVRAGEVLTYHLTLTNHGPGVASGAMLTDTLPGTVARIGGGGGPVIDCGDETCGGHTCTYRDLEPGASATMRIEVMPLAAGSITNTAVGFVTGDPDPTNNQASVVTTVLPRPVTPALLSIDGNSPRLLSVDPNTGATLASTPLTLAGETIEGGNGLAVHPTTGEVWALLRLAGQDGRELVTLDPTTGEASSVGDTGDRFAGLAFTPGTRLFGVTGLGASIPETLFQISKADATPTFYLSVADGQGGEAIAIQPTGATLIHASGGLTLNYVNLFIPFVTGTQTCTNLAPFTASALTFLGRGGRRVQLLADRDDLALYGMAGQRMTRIGQLDHVSKGLAILPPCVANDTTLCLPAEDGRFEVSVRYQTVQAGGRMGDAGAVTLERKGVDNGGMFYFSDSRNPEFLIKVLDGCGVNGHYWVFYGATTNVGFEVTVRDAVAEVVRTYANPDLNPAAPVLDTEAFATCDP